MLSNCHEAKYAKVNRIMKDGSKEEFECRVGIEFYHKIKGGVDFADQMANVHGLDRKSCKWYRVIHDIPGEQRSLTLDRLQPATEYQLYLVAFALSGHPTNISGKVHFVSPDVTQNDSWSEKGGPEEEAPTPFTVREEEVVIVVLVLAVWVFVIVLFFNKWGKIRMLEPYQPQYHSHPVIAKPSRLPLNDALAPLERFNLEFGAASTPYHLHKMRPVRTPCLWEALIGAGADLCSRNRACPERLKALKI
ncbi:rho guanine nucleotide exchange factor 10-like protein [Trichonephila clavata]|uniref:Rho guanine nucleotide exchange factor 10-like protein n=1 Tax=Trichonephila clavata TaxID=2740835 RepID=A0A8X6K5N0_TRICU|nr:rho guanine nucleotide exchange factor 10-like protein [Trichonephila clavata]